MKRRSGYKQTFFDRHGPAGELRLKAFGYGLMVFGTTVGAAFLAGTIAGVNMFAPFRLITTLIGAITLGALASIGSFNLGNAAGAAAKYFTAGGSSTPYQEQFSEEQALVMQRKYREALDLFEHRMFTSPGEPRVRMAAADLYATYGENPKRAAELYKEVQRMPDVMSGHDIYVSNKLADLYLGALEQPGKALGEFRRLMDRYPGSKAAAHAKLALDNLKQDIVKTAE